MNRKLAKCHCLLGKTNIYPGLQGVGLKVDSLLEMLGQSWATAYVYLLVDEKEVAIIRHYHLHRCNGASLTL